MLSFSRLVLNDKLPVYQQIIIFIKQSLLTGEAENDDMLPSRRELATLLDINPNTVQKAYRIMEEEGLIITVPNHGSYIQVDADKLGEIAEEMKETMVGAFIEQAKGIGLTLKQTEQLLEKMWNM